MANQKQKQHSPNDLPSLTNPMHLSPEYVSTKLEKSGIDDPIVSTIERGISEVSSQFEQVNEARQKIGEDRTLNSYAKKVEFAKFVDKQADRISKKTLTLLEAVEGRINEMNERIHSDISVESTKRPFTGETRQHVKSMDDLSGRLSFVKQQIDKGAKTDNWFAVSAILGAPDPFLVGLTDEHFENLREYYRKKRYPDEHNAIEHLTKIKGGLFKRLDILGRFEKEVKTDSVLKDLERQKARQQSMS